VPERQLGDLSNSRQFLLQAPISVNLCIVTVEV
jgi:hypothetical protein